MRVPALICGLPLVALGYGLSARDSVDIDGDVPLMHAASDQLAVTVFASAEPFRTGPNDVATLVQNPTSGEAILDADIEVSAQPIDGTGAEIYAARNIAINRLLKAAELNFPSSGLWNVKARV